ncbi:MAG: translation initiation factor [Alistipes sp.]|nr:translation initiation factor [Alistipes sp.]
MNDDWKQRLKAVYSTNPDFDFGDRSETVDTPPPSKQELRLWLERHRAGKVATVIRGFVGSADELNQLARMLKTRCGTGGTAKDGEIIIQGDRRDKIAEILAEAGYRCKKAGG